MKLTRTIALAFAAFAAIFIAPASDGSGFVGGRYVTGQLLVASPTMGDPRFADTVIYMVNHDAGGAMGLVVNRAMGSGPLNKFLEGLNIDTEGVSGNIRLHYGGPVEPWRGFLLHTSDYIGPGTTLISKEMALTVKLNVLKEIGKGNGPRQSLLAFGYAGWAPGQLERELATIADEQEELFCRRQLDWMRETRMAVVVSEEQGEVDKFRKWDLDITPHRRLMKEGIDLPESMRAKPEYRNMQTMALDDAFKAEEHPLRVAIVCAMWLTGFDVPSLATLYLDKPLKAHTLMQAIARANRVNEGKNNGLIVDYCGILKNLRKALATFAGTQPEGEGGAIDPARPDEELLADLAEAIALVRAFLEDRDATLDDIIQKTGFERNAAIVACKEAANENDESRKRFEVMCREVFKKFKACINVQGVNAHRSDRDAINIVYKSLQQDREKADISGIIRQLHLLVNDAIEVRPDGEGYSSSTY